mmetsp:Transcript_158498/g.504330  ORF Transcript_158498/g.504330 Transcript_158498/m.504330 type:complete len:477 (-) Transcript_158498:1309-2739(-)
MAVGLLRLRPQFLEPRPHSLVDVPLRRQRVRAPTKQALGLLPTQSRRPVAGGGTGAGSPAGGGHVGASAGGDLHEDRAAGLQRGEGQVGAVHPEEDAGIGRLLDHAAGAQRAEAHEANLEAPAEAPLAQPLPEPPRLGPVPLQPAAAQGRRPSLHDDEPPRQLRCRRGRRARPAALQQGASEAVEGGCVAGPTPKGLDHAVEAQGSPCISHDLICSGCKNRASAVQLPSATQLGRVAQRGTELLQIQLRQGLGWCHGIAAVHPVATKFQVCLIGTRLLLLLQQLGPKVSDVIEFEGGPTHEGEVKWADLWWQHGRPEQIPEPNQLLRAMGQVPEGLFDEQRRTRAPLHSGAVGRGAPWHQLAPEHVQRIPLHACDLLVQCPWCRRADTSGPCRDANGSGGVSHLLADKCHPILLSRAEAAPREGKLQAVNFSDVCSLPEAPLRSVCTVRVEEEPAASMYAGLRGDPEVQLWKHFGE